jgi:uncharacterized protein (TIGR00369 family)
MPTFEPRMPDYEERVRATFAGQRLMETIGARLLRVAPGEVEIELPFRADLTQQHGTLHAGVVTAIADTACGVAAFSLMPPDSAVLSIEYKVNFLAPARGGRILARGRVVRPGRTLTVCAAEVAALPSGQAEEQEVLIATMLATMIRLPSRAGREG